MLCEARVKFFQKLLVVPATAAFALAPNLNGFAKESVKTAQDQQQTTQNNWLISQVDDEQNKDKDTLKISVTGTRSPRETKNVPASVTVIDKNEIDRRGITDFRDLFKYEPGVSVKSDGWGYFNSHGQHNINIRGMEDNRVLLQRDNINLPKRYDFSYQLGRGDYVDFNTLKSVEILKGPASSLYGSDALGGVISYQSIFPEDILKAGETFSLELPINYDGSSEKISGTTRVGIRDDKTGLEGVVVLTASEGNEFDVKADKKYIDDREITKKSFYTNIVKNIDDYSRFNLIYENVYTHNEATLAKATLSSSYSNVVDDREIERWMGSLGYEYDNPDSNIFFNYAKFNVYVQDALYSDDSIVDYPAGMSRGRYTAAKTTVNNYGLDDESEGFNLQFRSEQSSGNLDHKFSYGIDLSNTFNSRARNKTTTQSGSTTVQNIKDTPDADTLQYGIYVQDEITFKNNPKLELIAGLRYDKNDIDAHTDTAYETTNDGVGTKNEPKDLDNSTLNPSLALIYKVKPELSAFAKYSTAFRSPTYHELNVAYGNRFWGYYIQSSPDLEPETSVNYEVGLKGDYPKFDFSLIGFVSNYEDLIDLAPIGTDPSCVGLIGRPCTIEAYSNTEEAEISGIEWKSDYNFNGNEDGFSLLSSLAYTYGDDTSSSDSKPLTSIEPFKAILGLKYTALENKWSAKLTNTYVGDARTTSALENNPSESYSVLDFMGDLRVNDRLSLDLGIYNLNDTRYFNYSTVKSQNANDVDINRYSEPGRNIKGGFKFVF